MPYFKALNVALKTSKAMVNHTIKFFQGDQDQLRKYEEYYTKEIKWKMMNAELKTAGLNQVGCDYCYHLCSC